MKLVPVDEFAATSNRKNLNCVSDVIEGTEQLEYKLTGIVRVHVAGQLAAAWELAEL